MNSCREAHSIGPHSTGYFGWNTDNLRSNFTNLKCVKPFLCHSFGKRTLSLFSVIVFSDFDNFETLIKIKEKSRGQNFSFFFYLSSHSHMPEKKGKISQISKTIITSWEEELSFRELQKPVIEVFFVLTQIMLERNAWINLLTQVRDETLMTKASSTSTDIPVWKDMAAG